MPSVEDVNEFTHFVDSSSHEKLVVFVRSQINLQLLNMYNSVDEAERACDALRGNLPVHVKKDEERSILLRGVGYCVETKPSLVPGAGDGAFVSSNSGIPPGTVVSLYPGLVHLKEFLREDSYFSSILPDPDFMLMARIDEALIDGRSVDKVPYNPYSVGHKINHCGNDRKPNVMQVSFDYANDFLVGDKFPHHLRRHVPNAFARAPTIIGKLSIGPTTFMPGIVLVSTRHLSDGDELLMDYRLDPDSSALPAWYRPYNEVESRNRWS